MISKHNYLQTCTGTTCKSCATPWSKSSRLRVLDTQQELGQGQAVRFLEVRGASQYPFLLAFGLASQLAWSCLWVWDRVSSSAWVVLAEGPHFGESTFVFCKLVLELGCDRHIFWFLKSLFELYVAVLRDQTANRNFKFWGSWKNIWQLYLSKDKLESK